ncbi:hypothetical protein [Rhizobium sp. PL01]|uniref:hypothetical protein n=1 Tax=Rhizobium sp. PL01 TaxID=3085631 RepID=UPI002981A9AD|nr:hypothetical protein [Rhizobium sp. PL01]MDW5315022.1 hypothetical protein [Rhizobium sp. PL01]
MADTAENVYRDYVTDGVPASGKNDPNKAAIRRLLKHYEALITAFTTNGGLIYTSKAQMDADLLHGAKSSAWVIGDATVANNGIYQKQGFSGTGSWTRVADLPYSFIIASDVGAGTPNAIQATTSIPVSASALVWMNVFEANTSVSVTVQFNGTGPVYNVKTNSGNNPAIGGFVAGMVVLGMVSGSTFRLLSDQTSAALLAQVEAVVAGINVGAFATALQGAKADANAITLSGFGRTTQYGTIQTVTLTDLMVKANHSADPTKFPNFGPAVFEAQCDGIPGDGTNANGVSGSVHQNNAPGDWSFPIGVVGYGRLDSAGNQVFGFFGRADLYTAGVATHELNTFNYSLGPPGTFPPNRSFGTSASLGITLTLAAGGTYQSLIACQVGPEGSEPNSYVCGFYTNADGVTGYGYIVDATATLGPTFSGVLNNTGQGANVHLQFQTKGTAQAANFVTQHLNAGGTRTWGITQDGAYFIGSTKVLDNDAWTSFTPTVAATTGTITTVGAVSGKYKRVGRTVFVDVDVTITTNGTGAGQITIGGMPVASARLVTAFFGREAGLSNKALHGSISAAGSTMTVFDYAGAYPAASGARLLLAGRYEV